MAVLPQPLEEPRLTLERRQPVATEAELEDLARLVGRVPRPPHLAELAPEALSPAARRARCTQALLEHPVRAGHDDPDGGAPAHLLVGRPRRPALARGGRRRERRGPQLAHLAHLVRLVHALEAVGPVVAPDDLAEPFEVRASQDGPRVVEHGSRAQDLPAAAKVHDPSRGGDLEAVDLQRLGPRLASLDDDLALVDADADGREIGLRPAGLPHRGLHVEGELDGLRRRREDDQEGVARRLHLLAVHLPEHPAEHGPVRLDQLGRAHVPQPRLLLGRARQVAEQDGEHLGGVGRAVPLHLLAGRLGQLYRPEGAFAPLWDFVCHSRLPPCPMIHRPAL